MTEIKWILAVYIQLVEVFSDVENAHTWLNLGVRLSGQAGCTKDIPSLRSTQRVRGPGVRLFVLIREHMANAFAS